MHNSSKQARNLSRLMRRSDQICHSKADIIPSSPISQVCHSKADIIPSSPISQAGQEALRHQSRP